MAVTATHKENMIRRSMDLARRLAEWNQLFNSFKEEYDAESFGTVIQTGDLTAFPPSNGLTATEWTDGVGAMDTVSGSVETNKTNIYKIAAAS